MFVLKKLITPFLLPPGLFIVVLMLIGAWSLRRRNAAAVWAAAFTAALIWILSISPAADLLIQGLEADLTVPSDIQGDVILMLGGSVHDRSPDYTGRGAPGEGTMERMVTALRLHRRLGIPIVVSGGKVYATGGAIAEITKRFLVDLGVKPQAVILEDRSRDTYENALFCRNICRRYGFTRPILVTSGYHMKRALLCFKKVGLNVTPMPCGLITWPGKFYGWQNWLPSSASLRTVALAGHEWIGLVYTRLMH